MIGNGKGKKYIGCDSMICGVELVVEFNGCGGAWATDDALLAAARAAGWKAETVDSTHLCPSCIEHPVLLSVWNAENATVSGVASV